MRFLSLLSALLLVACSASSNRDAIKREVDAVFAECERRFEAGELPSNVAEARCQTKGSFRILEEYGSNDMDLMQLEAEMRMEIAKRVDSGTAGPEDLVEYENLWAQIEEEMDRRDRLFGKKSRSQPEGERPAGNCRMEARALVCDTTR